ncbi:MAG: DUF1501 domain-containing protein [Acidimicrobiales bacterium]
MTQPHQSNQPHQSSHSDQPRQAHGLSRRQFLTGAAGIGALGVAGLTLGRGPIESLLSSATPAKAAVAGTGSPALVLLTLYGGNDGLNTVIPYSDSAYLSGRGTLAYQPNEVIPVAEGLGFHPNLVGFKQLWQAGHLAVVRGVGYPNPSFSHFRSMDIWQSANPTSDVATGWLGRWLDATGTDPLRALSVGPNLPMALTGAKSGGSAITAGSLKLPGSALEQAGFQALQIQGSNAPALYTQVAQSGRDMLRVQHSLVDLLGPNGLDSLATHKLHPTKAPAPGTPSTAPSGVGSTAPSGAGSTAPSGVGSTAPSGAGNYAGVLGSQLDLVTRLIKAGSPTRVYGVSLGSFDTHANEKADQSQLLAEMDAAVTSFVNGLVGEPHGHNTVLMAYSEFGRRVAGNASGGTDHGSAGPVFVAGPSVKGGFYGDEPSLTKLVDGNLIFTTDFRSVYATVLANVLGEDPKVSLGQAYPSIAFV